MDIGSTSLALRKNVPPPYPCKKFQFQSLMGEQLIHVYYLKTATLILIKLLKTSPKTSQGNILKTTSENILMKKSIF